MSVAGGLGAAGRERTVHAAVVRTGAVTRAIQNVALFDGTGASPQPGTTVLVNGEYIEAVLDRPAALSEGTPVIDGSGLTLLPGLIDTHVHWDEWMAPLFLRYGVTAVRDVGNSAAVILDARLRERRGTLRAPRISAYGRWIDGAPPRFPLGSIIPTSLENARVVAENQLANDLDGLKVYSQLPPHLMREVVAVATAHGVPVAAHLGVTSAREAVDVGVRSIEHVIGVSTRETPQSQEALAVHMAERGVFMSATLHMQHLGAAFPANGGADYPHLDQLPPRLAAAWRTGRDPTNPSVSLPNPPDVSALLAREIAMREAFLRRFHQAGGRVTTGTDTSSIPFVMPGLSVHQEMALLVAVGLSASEALRAATSAAAELLQRPDLGVIAPGKLADLVLVEGDPTKGISATRNIRLVLKGGAVVHSEVDAAHAGP